MFSGDSKRDQWHEMGYVISLRSALVFRTIVSEILSEDL